MFLEGIGSMTMCTGIWLGGCWESSSDGTGVLGSMMTFCVFWVVAERTGVSGVLWTSWVTLSTDTASTIGVAVGRTDALAVDGFFDEVPPRSAAIGDMV